MSGLADYFLRAKHWQLFLLFSMFCVGQMASMKSVSLTSDGFRLGLPFWILEVLFSACFIAWWWSLGSFLNSLLAPALRLNVGFFRFSMIYPLIYVFAFMWFFQNPIPLLFAVILPFHLLAMFCMFYGLYFVSKSLVMAEAGRAAAFYDYAGPFFLLWFFPIGIWVLQPRINRLYASRMGGELVAGSNGD